MARLYGVSQRRIQQLVKIYKDTGEYPTLNPNRRPKTYLTEKEKDIIEKAHKKCYLGARLLRYHIKKYYKVLIIGSKVTKNDLTQKEKNLLDIVKKNPGISTIKFVDISPFTFEEVIQLLKSLKNKKLIYSVLKDTETGKEAQWFSTENEDHRRDTHGRFN